MGNEYLAMPKEDTAPYEEANTAPENHKLCEVITRIRVNQVDVPSHHRLRLAKFSNSWNCAFYFRSHWEELEPTERQGRCLTWI